MVERVRHHHHHRHHGGHGHMRHGRMAGMPVEKKSARETPRTGTPGKDACCPLCERRCSLAAPGCRRGASFAGKAGGL